MSAVLASPSSKLATRLPPAIPTVPVWRFTVEDYHHLIDQAVLTEDDPVELLEGYLVPKMPKGKGHDGTIGALDEYLDSLLPPGCRLRIQSAVTLADSEPEPDVVVVRGTVRQFFTAHPTPQEIGIVIEVADTSMKRDRLLKGRIYARSKIPVYWIMNLVDRQVEVYTQPGIDAAGQPAYGPPTIHRPGDLVSVVLFGQEVGKLAVADLLPN